MDITLKGLSGIAIIIAIAAGCSMEREDGSLVETYNQVLMRSTMDTENSDGRTQFEHDKTSKARRISGRQSGFAVRGSNRRPERMNEKGV